MENPYHPSEDEKLPRIARLAFASWDARYGAAFLISVGVVVVFSWFESDAPRYLWLAWILAVVAGLYVAFLVRELVGTVFGLGMLWAAWALIDWIGGNIGPSGSSAILTCLAIGSFVYAAMLLSTEIQRMRKDIADLRALVFQLAETNLEVGERRHREVMRVLRPTAFD